MRDRGAPRRRTVSLRAAQTLGFTLFDTGALYRTIALAADDAKIAWDNAEAMTELTRGLVESRRLRIEPTEAIPS